MPNQSVTTQERHGQKFFVWMSSTLLLVQLLTITIILRIVSADESQNKLAVSEVALMDSLDQLALSIDQSDRALASAGDGSSWIDLYQDYRVRFATASNLAAAVPELTEILQQTDILVRRMSQIQEQMRKPGTDTALMDRMSDEFQQEKRSSEFEVQNAQRLVRMRLSLAGEAQQEKTGYLKLLLAGACVLAFGVAFLFRQYRVDRTTWRKFEKELRDANEELLSALHAAQEGSAAKNQFLANISHEMRTPLNGIIGMTSILIDTNLNEEQREYAQTSLDSARSLVYIINDLLDFSKMEAGKIELGVVAFDPRAALQDVVKAFSTAAALKHLNLESDVAASVPALVEGDPGRLRQVLTNLVGNAVKFTDAGRVSISVQRDQNSSRKFRFEVKDTGIGLSEDARARLFQPFVQADGSITRKYGGTGLGLAISKKLVELMGGEIGVKSAPDHGSTFWFTVNLAPVSGAAPENLTASAATQV